jgi:hypothetical protein
MNSGNNSATTKTKGSSSSGSGHLSQSVHSTMIGNQKTLQLGRKEVREQRHIVTYEPSHQWWEPPLSAWLPEYNREILALLFLYNTLIVLLARFTSLCGTHSDSDVETHDFCSDDFMLLEDQALTGFTVGMFLLLAFRANQAYDRFWEGRKSWGRMREVARDYTRLVCTYVIIESNDDLEDRRRAIAFVTAFGAAVKLHLRKERDIQRDLQGDLDVGCSSSSSGDNGEACRPGILDFQDLANIQSASHMPLFCQDILSHYLFKQHRAGKLSDYQMGCIESALAVMSVSFTCCVRDNLGHGTTDSHFLCLFFTFSVFRIAWVLVNAFPTHPFRSRMYYSCGSL